MKIRLSESYKNASFTCQGQVGVKSSFFPDSLWSYLACGLHFGRRLHRDRQCGLGPSQVEPLVKFLLFMYYKNILGFPSDSDGKESTCHVRDLGSIPGLGRSPGGGHCKPLQYSCLENPHGQRSLAGYSPWDHKESDTTEWLSKHSTAQIFAEGLLWQALF